MAPQHHSKIFASLEHLEEYLKTKKARNKPGFRLPLLLIFAVFLIFCLICSFYVFYETSLLDTAAAFPRL